MKIKKISYILLVLLLSIEGYSQKSIVNTINRNKVEQERLFVHLNSSFLFTGEYLYFKIYCLNTKSVPSDISKIAYVDVVNQENKKVYSRIFQLEDGIGYGDFFIPVKIPSGNYKLLAYTNWMQNNKEEKFYSQDLFIVNPYTSDQKSIRKDSISLGDKQKFSNPTTPAVMLHKNQFENRDLVEVKLPSLEKGLYSVSVKLKDSIPHPEVTSAKEFTEKVIKNSVFENDIKEIPELRGKLIKGTIESEDTLNLKDTKIALTVSGNDYYLKIINSDSEGNFVSSVDRIFQNEDAYLQVLDDSYDHNYKIQLEEPGSPVPPGLKFSHYSITTDMAQMIVDRSIRNQVENAYFTLKPDTIKFEKKEYLFKELDRVIYNLDEYKRFKTLRQTFIEVVQYSNIRESDKGYEISVLGYPPKENFDGEALLLVDGYPVKDKEKFIINYPATSVEKIEIIRDKVFLSGSTYKGIVLIETKGKDFILSYQPDYIEKFKLTSGNLHKNYFKQSYSDPIENENLPDFRTQLLWDPDVVLDQNNSFDFYTSDVDGEFEISIQGFTKEGDPVSLYNIFTVE